MKIRVKFAKYGNLRFLGHLDIMRYFQKALTRSGLSVKYSEGYHPHPVMSFAQPLGLSLTSDGEYFDVELTKDYTEEEIFVLLQAQMCEEVAIRKVTILAPYIPNTKKVSGMSLISGAVYALQVKSTKSGITEKTAALVAGSEHFMVQRKTKTTNKEYDLQSGLHYAGLLTEQALTVWKDDTVFSVTEDFCRDGLTHALMEPTAFTCILALDAGSERNCSPELFSMALCKAAEIEYDPLLFYIHRMELYGDGKDGCKIPLWMIR